MIDTESDNDIFFADFGEQFRTARGLPIDGIYAAPGRVADQYDGGVMSTAPGLVVKQADVDRLEIGNGSILTRTKTGEVFQIAGPPEPDGFGLLILSLTMDF